MAFFDSKEKLLQEARGLDAENWAIAEEMHAMAREFHIRMGQLSQVPETDGGQYTGYQSYYTTAAGEFYTVDTPSGGERTVVSYEPYRVGLTFSLAPARDSLREAMAAMLRGTASGQVGR